MTIALESYALNREEGPAVWFMGRARMTVKATGEQTNGAFSLIEEVAPPGYATIYHKHLAADEVFYVLEGEVTLVRNDEKLKAGPGTYVFLPRGISHGYRVTGTTPARLLLFISPAGLEHFFLEAGEPVTGPNPPPPAPPDREKLMALGTKYNNVSLGPLPE